MNSPWRTRLAGNRSPLGLLLRSIPSKSPSFAIARPVGSTTTISSAWFAATQRLSCSSMIKPSAPLMLFTKTLMFLASATGPDMLGMTGIFTTLSVPVLATKSTVVALLNADMTSAVKFRANAGGAADGRSSLHAARAAAMRPRAMAARNAITQWRQDRRSDRGPLYRYPGQEAYNSSHRQRGSL